jgi:O-methyltransferase involved in polyketide biosynthesis
MSADTTQPHIARIYDYVLGGTFNHDVDRRAAAAIVDLVPAYPRWARQNRAFLSHVGRRWAEEGRTAVLDLGSGLPTAGHFNEHLPDARVLFVDSDPLTVSQGRALLAGTPGMAYAELDIRAADALVAQAASFFGEARRLAVGSIGVAYFLSDDELGGLMRRLHAFTAPGSTLVVTFHEVPPGPDHEASKEALLASARHARINFYARTAEQMADLLAPWRVVSIHDLGTMFPDAAPPPVRPEHATHRARIVGAFLER